MKKQLLLLAFGCILLASSAFIFHSCKHTSGRTKFITVNPAFREYVDGFTTGNISTESAIKVRLAYDLADTSMLGKTIENSLFSFSPKIKGTCSWEDTRTVQFKPEKPLKPDTYYETSFHLSKLMKIPDSLSTMKFSFQTIKQDFDVFLNESSAYSADNPKYEQLTGYILTADVEQLENVSEMLKVKQNGKKLKCTFNQEKNRKKFNFIIDSISRGKDYSQVSVDFNGSKIHCDNSGSKIYNIAPLDNFEVRSVKTTREPDICIKIHFSDFLDGKQELQGLVTLGRISDFSYIIDKQDILIYPTNMELSNELLKILPEVKNYAGKKFGKEYSEPLYFESMGPDVRFVNAGTILPSTDGMLVPFEAINVKAVDVKIIRIFQQNIPQFLQVNELENDYQMSRVGRVVLKKTLPLTALANYNQWNRYYIDLSEMITPEKGAIYSLQLSIRKEFSVYPCGDNEGNDEQLYAFFNESDKESDDNWTYYYDDYYDYDYDYNEDYNEDYDYDYSWTARNNPCKKYYYSNRTTSTNILATDIGLMSKMTGDGELTIFASDITDAKPMEGVDLQVLNYQQQVIGTASTGKDGSASIKLTNPRPFLVIASKKDERSYLKLSSGKSLSLSSFDVSGEKVEKGLKGFMYAERGVWRPGDSVFVTLILQDPEKSFPPEHPVIFELYNPLGTLIQKKAVTKQLNGFYSFYTATSQDDITGAYRLVARVGKISFTQSIRVETIKPNRLKIEINQPAQFISTANPKPLDLSAKWLHGANAAGLKTEMDITLSKTKTEFKNYQNVVFDDISHSFQPETFSMFSGKLDVSGKASVSPVLDIHNAPGMLHAQIETRVYEPGGEFSVDYYTTNVSPFGTYAGIKIPALNKSQTYLYTDKEQTIELLNVTENGLPVSSSSVKAELYKTEWQYWWSGYDDYNSEFMSSSDFNMVIDKTLEIKNGKTSLAVNIPKEDWGRYYLKVTDLKSGHCAGIWLYFDWYGYNRFADKEQTDAKMLVFTTDKPKYLTGEKIKVSLNAPQDSRAIVTVENGSKILEKFNVYEKSGKIEFTIKAEKDYAPNVYLSITLLQIHKNTLEGTPIRSYGVIPVFVENPETILKPILTVPEVMRPGTQATIQVKEEKGKPMTYTIAVVDQGLLDLTKNKLPDPYSKFYSKEALSTLTWDIYDDVIGAYGGELQRVLSIGGGDDGNIDASKQKANRFKPMVRYLGPFELAKGRTASHTFSIPEYVGAVKVMLVAGQNGAYGSTEKSAFVRNPLMLLGTVPRVLGPGESCKVPVSVFAMEKDVKNVTLTIKTSKNIKVLGNTTKNIQFAKTGDQLVEFEIQTLDQLGIGTIEILAASGTKQAKWKVEFDIRAANPMLTVVSNAIVKGGETWKSGYKPIGMKGTNEATIEISSFYPMSLDKWLTYLLDYPHGCAEQTVSGSFPLLYLDKLTNATDKIKKVTEQKIKKAITKIQNQQVPSGGIAMWPGSEYPDPWITSYAGHFLIEAAAKGYVVSKQALQKWVQFQKNNARSWKFDKTYYNNDLMQTYRLYTLALSGNADFPSMNRLYESGTMNFASKWLMTSAFVIAGRPDIAKSMAEYKVPALSKYNEFSYTYGSDLRDKSFQLEAYIRLKMNKAATEVIKDIASELTNNSWLSTQTVSQCLRTVSLFLSIYPQGSQMDYVFTLNNKQTPVTSQNTVQMFPITKENPESGAYSIVNKGKGTLYVRLIQKGIPKESQTPAAQNNLKLSVKYYDVNGAALNPDVIVQGTVFYAEVNIQHPSTLSNYSQLALTHIIPSGWEIMNNRFAFDAISSTEQKFDYQDIRDDRVLTYFSLAKGNNLSVKIKLSASYSGTFYMPMIYCEAMYDNRVNASLSGKWVRVVQQDELAGNLPKK